MATLRVIFENGDPERVIEFNPTDAPFQEDGRPGSILDILLGHKIHLEHACGGNCACTTCHVIVKQGFKVLSEATEQEEDLLDRAPGLTPTSRLGCQAVIEDAERRDRGPYSALHDQSGQRERLVPFQLVVPKAMRLSSCSLARRCNAPEPPPLGADSWNGTR